MKVQTEDVRFQAGTEGGGELSIGRFEASNLRAHSGPATLDVDRIEISDLKAQLRSGAGLAGWHSLTASQVNVEGVKFQGQPSTHSGGHGPQVVSLAPLSQAEGLLRMDITDAHLLFDAAVTMPIRGGTVDFSDTSVAHIGPDSRMGVSHLGIYVDAPNGRSYLLRFASPPLEGVEFEERGTLLGNWVTRRGKIRLQPFIENLLGQAFNGVNLGLSEQARLLLGRTTLSGQMQLSDGHAALPGWSARLAGQADGHNAFTLHSAALQRGASLGMRSFLLRDVATQAFGLDLHCDELGGQLELQLQLEPQGEIHLAATLASCSLRQVAAGKMQQPEPGAIGGLS